MTALAIVLGYFAALAVVCGGLIATACIWGDPWQRPLKTSRRSRFGSASLKLNFPRVRP